MKNDIVQRTADAGLEKLDWTERLAIDTLIHQNQAIMTIIGVAIGLVTGILIGLAL